MLLGRLLAVAEAYPTLGMAEPVVKLMDSVKSVEDGIACLRYMYNNIVQEYNTKIRTFLSSMMSRWIGTRELPYLEVFEDDVVVRLKQVGYGELDEYEKSVVNYLKWCIG